MAAAGKKQDFRAKIVSLGPKGAWSYLQIPFDAEKLWGTKARLSVRGAMNGFAFRSSIFPDGKGGHTMMVNKAMQAGAKAGAGEAVKMELAPDVAPRTVTTPTDLKKALAGNKATAAFFGKISPSAKKMYVDWITGAKQAETRARRIAKAIEMLRAGKKMG
jgi:hypothetical protein